MKSLYICMVYDGERCIDLGNYYERDGVRVLLTSEKLAKEYGYLVDCPIYIRRVK